MEKKYDNGKTAERYYIINDSLIDGDYIIWDEDGNKFLTGHYIAGKANGKWIQYYSTGEKRIEGSFKNGKPDGVWITYEENGALLTKTSIKNGLLDGEWDVWYTAVNPNHIIFDCVTNYGNMTSGGGREEWTLRYPIDIGHSLIKAKGYFENGLPSGTWTIFEATHKEQERVYKKIKNEENYRLHATWNPENLKDGSADLSLKYFICDSDNMPDYPSYVVKTFNSKGQIIYKVEYKDGEKIDEWRKSE